MLVTTSTRIDYCLQSTDPMGNESIAGEAYPAPPSTDLSPSGAGENEVGGEIQSRVGMRRMMRELSRSLKIRRSPSCSCAGERTRHAEAALRGTRLVGRPARRTRDCVDHSPVEQADVV